MLRYREIKLALIEMVSMMKPGDRLPSRNWLCHKLETTRTTLDKAVRELVEEKVLVSVKGSGTRVVGMIEGTVQEAENWCVIVPDAMEEIYISLLKGIEKVSEQSGTNTIICSSHNNGDKQEQYIKRMMVSGIDGFIIVPIVSFDARESLRLYENLVCSKIPFVFCNREVEGVEAPVVKSNDFYGGLIATRHLIRMGYRRIAYVCEQKYTTSIERCQGYVSALLEEQMEINRRYMLIPSLGQQQDCYQSVLQLLTSEQPPDALFCFNDTIAVEAMRAVHDAGKRISQDVGVIGYDDTSVCLETKPHLTSIAYKSNEIGETAAGLLKKISHGIEPSTHFTYYLFQPELVVRSSCMGPETILQE